MQSWARNAVSAEALAGSLREQGIPARSARDLQSAVERSDLVSCATLAKTPLLQGKWLHDGAHVDLIGSFTSEMREVEDDVFRDTSNFVDTEEALHKSGELFGPMSPGNLRRFGRGGHAAAALFGAERGKSRIPADLCSAPNMAAQSAFPFQKPSVLQMSPIVFEDPNIIESMTNLTSRPVLSHLGIYTDRQDEMQAFYERALGLVVTDVGVAADGAAPLLNWIVNERHIEPHIPVWEKANRDDGTFSRSDFVFDAQKQTYACPGGKKLRTTGRATSADTLLFRAANSDCGGCALRQRCCPNTPHRKIPRSVYEGARDAARAVCASPATGSRARTARRSRCCSRTSNAS